MGACGPHILSLEVENWIKTARLGDCNRCSGCSKCSDVCPFGAICMTVNHKPASAGAHELIEMMVSDASDAVRLRGRLVLVHSASDRL